MITVKVPYKTSQENALAIKDIQRQYSSVVRYSYNRALEKKSQKEIRSLLKSLENISDLGCWLSQCAILEGIAIQKKNKDKKVIFGGQKNFIQRLTSKISNEEFKEKRLLPITVQGEKFQKGNRSFNLSHLSENKVVFKLNKKCHLELDLQPMKTNYKKKLEYIESLSQTKDLTVTIRLNDRYIYFIYEEPKVVTDLIQERYMGIDLNPNYIGISIKENDQVIHTQCFDVKHLTDKIFSEQNSSESNRFKHLNNKLKHETIMISKEISLLALKYKTKFIFIEDLKNIHLNDINGGHKLNRLTKNLWKRDIFIQNLSKRIALMGIKLFKVNASYSSVIGNVQHSYFDPINASLEIARRGYSVIILKNKQFYPNFLLKDQWKEHFSDVTDWKILFSNIKNSKMKYRVSLEDCQRSFEVFQMDSIRSGVKLYNFA